MKELDSKKYLMLEQAEAAEVLLSLSKARVLMPFMRETLSLSEAAKILGLKPSSTHYHIQKLLKLGLIELVRTEQNRGRLQKYYCASAQHFLIPSALMHLPTVLEKMYERIVIYNQSFVERLVEQEELGLAVFLSEDGLIEFEPVHVEEGKLSSLHAQLETAFLPQYSLIKLNEKQAIKLVNVLNEIQEEARAAEPKSEQKYLLGLSLIPFEES